MTARDPVPYYWADKTITELADEAREEGQRAPLMSALCCRCGNLRTVSSRYRRGFVGEWMDLENWSRFTCPLKCTACRRQTTHAVLRNDKFRDYAEYIQSVALGGEPCRTVDRYGLLDVERVRLEYRTGKPQPPTR